MEEQMSLDEYKALLKECLMRKGFTPEDADESIKNYEDIYPEDFEDRWSPEDMATTILMNF